MSKDLETQFSKTTCEINRMELEMENARALCLDSWKKKSKMELEAASLEEARITDGSDEMVVALRQLMAESENAKKESETMKRKLKS
ncbi:hypothetical protein L2E82_25865 [Cichorium intybus]|uniref:Uncharacterized protein n=1 Tax=Cichorium intybus TaxID=13427 RepID=A0ACB9E4Z2_CICIN|nr:hypothetical protein L2E82_25865 [Cichorium intybus]